MKADIVHFFTGQTVLAIPGVTSLHYLEKALKELTERSNDLANYYHTSLDYLLGLSNNHVNIEEKLNIDWDMLSKRILELRTDNKLTQKELSKKLGFPQTTYSQYETGKRKLTTLKLLVIAQYYDISSDYLVGRSNIKEIK